MSHKILSLEIQSDYLADITFFNGEVRQCDLSLLIETEPISAEKNNLLRRISELAIDKSRNGISIADLISIDAETLWGNSYALRDEAYRDPTIAFADALIDARDRMGLSQRDLELKSGVRQAEISKIERGEGNPSLKTVGKLFEAMGQSLSFTVCKQDTCLQNPDYPYVNESIAPYLNPKVQQGFYRVKDLENLPECFRIELINGVIYDMSVPSLPHQLIVKNITAAFDKYIEEQAGECITFSGQTGVWFEGDEKNLVIPDMFIVCDKDKLKYKGVVDAPDFVLEVLSPATRSRDLSLKLRLYQEKGVHEYWIVDLRNSKLLVYDWKHMDIPQIFGFDAVVPVGIYDGNLSINMNKICAGIRFEETE